MIVDSLLACPRGRTMCAALASALRPREWARASFHAAADATLEVLNGISPDEVAQLDAQAIWSALLHTADSAWYWQEPDAVNRLLERPEARLALTPIAEGLMASDSTQWWSDGVALDAQCWTKFRWQHGWGRMVLFGGSTHLQKWREDTVRHEERDQLRLSADPSEMVSGHWWSTPALSDTPDTTRFIGELGSVGLQVIEDSTGPTEAELWPVAPREKPRVYEITDPRSWAELVRRYPLDVTASRRHDWYRATGENPREWLIPDWLAVSADYDAVHLSVLGYLTTPGIAIPVDRAFTVLAGWDPDETFWLRRDLLQFDGEPTHWHLERTGWTKGPVLRQ